jgi:transketolase
VKPHTEPHPGTTLLGPQIRRVVLMESRRAHVGHIGSGLSVADIVGALYSGVLQISQPEDQERDRFILSKGHAALALYAALHLRGWISAEDLATFCGNGSLLGVHPEHELRGVDFSTGSLGHGLTYGAGSALAARLRGSSRRTFVLLSDAEYNEGSTWEAAMFAGHHRLSNLVAIVDLNGQQAFGYTGDVLDIGTACDQWTGFGWDVLEVDGHNEQGIIEQIAALHTEKGRPHVLIAHTTFGCGVSFMENQLRWHYLPMDDDQYNAAMREIGATR